MKHGFDSSPLAAQEKRPRRTISLAPLIRRARWSLLCAAALLAITSIGVHGIAHADVAAQCTSPGGGGLGPLPSSQALCDANGAWWENYAASQLATTGNSGWGGSGYSCSNVQPTSYVLLAWDNGVPGGNSYTVPVTCTGGYFLSSAADRKADNGLCCNPVSDPVNPATGNVYTRDVDVTESGQGALLQLNRFYNSADTASTDLGPGWRHSFSRSLQPNLTSAQYQPYLVSSTNSSTYSTPEAACSSGFAQLQPGVPTWTSATAAYTNNFCIISKGGTQIASLPMNYSFGPAPAPTHSPASVDVIRDDGQVIRFIVAHGGVLQAPPGTVLRLQQTDLGPASNWVSSDGLQGGNSLNSACTLYASAATLDPQAEQQGVTFANNGVTQSDPTHGTCQLLSTAPNGTHTYSTIAFQLVVAESYSYALTDENDTVESYDTNGRLLSVQQRTGLTQTLSYDSRRRLQSVVDTFGNELTFGYGSQDRLTSVSDADSKVTKYVYDSQGRLSTVTYPDSTTRQYVYESPSFPDALSGVIDENGTRYSTWGYDTQGRAITTSEAGNAGSTSLTYNADGSVTVTDALGAVRTFGFSRYGDRNRTASISGSQCLTCTEGLATTYDNAGFVSSRTDYNGNLTCYKNDLVRGLELARLEGMAPGSTCPADLSTYTPAPGTRQRLITTQWNSTWREPALITEPRRTTGFTYDTSGNLHTRTVTDISTTPNVSRTRTYTYDIYGHLLTEDGPRTDVADVTTYTYYSCATGAQCGQVQTITDAAGHVTTFNTYNSHGQPLTITDANGVVTTLTYDLRQRLTSKSTAGETTRFDYWPTGLLKKVTLPDGSYLQYTYDAAHRLTTIADGLGNNITYTLDALGNWKSENVYDPSNSLHRTHTRVFNSLGELYQDVNAAGSAAVTTTFGYDGNGNQTTTAAPMGRNTTEAYDELNRLRQITDPASGVTQLAYDSSDNLISVTDPRSLVTSYTYNALGDLLGQLSPDTGTTTNTYDSAGNLATSTDARGAVSTYTYDALNRVSSLTYSVGGSTDQTVSFTYDAGANGNGHLTGASDANHSLGWSYSASGSVIGKSQTVAGVTHSVGYAYTSGNLTTLTTPSGQTVTYGYNGNHQVTSVAVNGTTVLTGVSYEPFGATNGWTWGNSTTATRSYDADGNITQISSSGLKTLSYDNASRISRITDAAAGASNWIYGYDALDRLTSGDNGTTTRGWTYDTNGNRLTETGTSASAYSVSPTGNRVTGITGDLARTYSYDAAGHTTGYASMTATYNNAGRLKTVSNGSLTETLVYNALGQRIETSGGAAGTVLYWYDEQGHLLGEYDGSGNLIEETVWLGDIPVATLRPNGASVAIYYVHTDQLNTPRQVTRPSDNAQMWTWFSDPFGTDAANSNPAGAGSFIYNLRFPGQAFDGQVGLHYNHFRDFDPATGGYIESDPIGLNGGSYSTYVYAGGNPLSYSDPAGLAPPGRAEPGSGVPSLLPPGPFDESWNKSRDAAALALEEWINRAVNTVKNWCSAHENAVDDAMLAEQETLTADEEAAIRDKAAGKPYDQATYNRARQKQIKNEKYNKERNKRKRGG